MPLQRHTKRTAKRAKPARPSAHHGTAGTPLGASGTSLPPGLSFPGFSLALAATEQSAMNLLLGVFPVPPFLLPVYVTAGVDYGVPWEVLAAINEVETNYGRNLATSSAGAVGWMQFLPSTWLRFGMDADGRGRANPYDPVDAIFAAARYLHAAGAESSLAGAIYAYNHADWYVNSVELRARLLRYMPSGTVDGLTGLMQSIFPVAGHLGRYARQAVTRERVAGRLAAMVHAPVGAPVVAVADGRIIAIGRNPRLGRFITLQDSYGDRFTYSGLANLNAVYPVLKPTVQSALALAKKLRSGVPRVPPTKLPAATTPPNSAQSTGAGALPPTALPPTTLTTPAGSEPPTAAMPKERLFANPARPASYAAGGRIQVEATLASYAAAANIQVGRRGPLDYFSQPVRLGPKGFDLAPLTRGVVVAAGTILGHVGATHAVSGVTFQIKPAGARLPIDPRPILAGWELVGRLTAGHAALVGSGQSSAFGAQNPSLGQLLLGSKQQLERAVLGDRRVSLEGCGRRAVRDGQVDWRVLAVIEYLSYSDLGPTAAGFSCSVNRTFAPRLYISRIDGVPVAGHQQVGGIVDLTIRRVLGLEGALHPSAVLSLRRYPMQPIAVVSSSDAGRVEVDFPQPPLAGGGTPSERLDTAQWNRLMTRLAQLSPAQP